MVSDSQSTVTDTYTAGAPTTTFAHVTSTALNRILIVAVQMNIRNSTGTTVESIAYGGEPLAFLGASTSAIGGTVEARREVWYRVENTGPSAATGVVVTDPLPAGMTFVSSTTTLGSCTGSPTVTCTLGTMTAGQIATVTIQVTAPLAGGFTASNTATVSSENLDPGTSNTAGAVSFVLAQPALLRTQPGKNGAGGTLAGTINSYWQGNSSPTAGATSLTATFVIDGAAAAGARGITVTTASGISAAVHSRSTLPSRRSRASARIQDPSRRYRWSP